MRRIQFIEIHERSWFASSIRNDVTDALQFGLNLLKAYGPIALLLQNVLRTTESHSIVDICSGAGGPWLNLSHLIRGNTETSFEILLTDKYPNLTACRNAGSRGENQISAYPDSVDALKVPSELKGFRTMFSSFHHFPTNEARAVLQDAVDAGQCIGIFEITKRAPFTVGLMFPWALLLFICTPFIRPFRWSRLFWTFLVPIIPFVLLFDGIVSCLRTYRPEELREILDSLAPNEYHWEIGECPTTGGLMPITYLIGHPPICLSRNETVSS